MQNTMTKKFMQPTMLPTILPINELKNTANISKICEENITPIIITKNGYSNMVIMTPEYYEEHFANIYINNLLDEALDSIENGDKGENAFEVIKGLRAKYEI